MHLLEWRSMSPATSSSETALLMSLAHKNFSTFPKHRWLGADSSLDQIALCCVVHNIGAEVFLVMRQAVQSKEPASVIVARQAAPSQQRLELGRDLEGPPEGLAQAGSSVISTALQPLQSTDPDSDEDAAAGEEQDWSKLAAKNARTRKKATSLRTSCRSILERQLMASQDARVSLQVMAEHAKVETVQLEWGHTSAQ